MRSLLRAAIKRRSVDDVYANIVDIVRDAVLGVASAEGGARTGLGFKENGMRVSDVEILDVTIGDEDIAELLGEAQRQAVEEGISIVRARRGLELTKQREAISRATAEEEAATRRRRRGARPRCCSRSTACSPDGAEGEVRKAVSQLDVARAKNAAIEIDHSAEICHAAVRPRPSRSRRPAPGKSSHSRR